MDCRPLVRYSSSAGLVCCLLMLIGCSGQTATPLKSDESPGTGSSSQSSQSSARSSSPASRSSSVPDDIEFTPQGFNEEFFGKSSAWTAAAARYDGRFLRVTGQVKISAYGSGAPYLLLEGTDLPFSSDEVRPGARAMPGQTVVLRGKCTKQFLGVVSWKIVKVTGDPPPTMAAEQLLKELVADEDGFKVKYERKWLVLTGQITAVNTDLDGVDMLMSPPGTKPVVSCRFKGGTTGEKKRNLELRAGKKAKVLGMYHGGGQFGYCELVEIEP